MLHGHGIRRAAASRRCCDVLAEVGWVALPAIFGVAMAMTIAMPRQTAAQQDALGSRNLPVDHWATDYVRRVDLAIELGTDRLRRRRPVTYRLVQWVLARATKKLDRQRPLIDPDLFRTHKRYLSFVFER